MVFSCSTAFLLTADGRNSIHYGVSAPTNSDAVRFTAKGQVVIPARLCKRFHIVNGTRAIVIATDEGILLKPVTAAMIKRGRGIVKRKPYAKPLTEEWAEHKREEYELEEAKLARHGS